MKQILYTHTRREREREREGGREGERERERVAASLVLTHAFIGYFLSPKYF